MQMCFLIIRGAGGVDAGGCDMRCWLCHNWQDQMFARALEMMESDLSKGLVFSASPLVFGKCWFHSCSVIEKLVLR